MYKSFTPIFEFQITPSNFQNFDRNFITQTVFSKHKSRCCVPRERTLQLPRQGSASSAKRSSRRHRFDQSNDGGELIALRRSR